MLLTTAKNEPSTTDTGSVLISQISTLYSVAGLVSLSIMFFQSTSESKVYPFVEYVSTSFYLYCPKHVPLHVYTTFYLSVS